MYSKPTAILFDMGGVLLESADMWDASGFPKSFPSGLPNGASVDWFMALSRDILSTYENQPQPRPAIDARPIIRDHLGRAGFPNDAASIEFWYEIVSQWEVRPLYPWVRESLSRIRGMGYRLGLVSNTLMVTTAHRELFRAEGILDLFDVLVFSAEFGMNKPDPSIFLHALDRMSIAGPGAWYVGDKPHRDMCGAHRVGMTGVLVDSIYHERIGDAPENAPDIRIRDIEELPDVLAARAP